MNALRLVMRVFRVEFETMKNIFTQYIVHGTSMLKDKCIHTPHLWRDGGVVLHCLL